MQAQSIVVTFILVSISSVCVGQDLSEDTAPVGITKDQVYHRGFFERGKINGNLSYQTGRVSDFQKDTNGAIDFSKPVDRLRNTLALNIGINLFERVYFRTTFNYNLNKNINAPWIVPDYAYIIERANWDPNSFSYGYMNYELNRYSDSFNSFLENVSKGSFFVRYYNQLPTSWIRPVQFDSTAGVSFSVSIRYAFRYQDIDDQTAGDLMHGKPVGLFSLRYVFLKNMFVEGAALFYLHPATQLHYDPDFTYGFGYNSYKHMSIAFSYGNYAVNRFPWNEKKVKGYGFLDGQFSIMLNYSW